MTQAQRAAKQYRMEQWATMISDRVESGTSVTGWCRENGVSQRVYYYRLRQVREYAADAMIPPGDVVIAAKPATGERLYDVQRERQRRVSAPGFAEVEVVEPPNCPALPEVSSSPGQLHIELDGMRISIDSAYPPDKLAALLRELRRPC